MQKLRKWLRSQSHSPVTGPRPRKLHSDTPSAFSTGHRLAALIVTPALLIGLAFTDMTGATLTAHAVDEEPTTIAATAEQLAQRNTPTDTATGEAASTPPANNVENPSGTPTTPANTPAVPTAPQPEASSHPESAARAEAPPAAEPSDTGAVTPFLVPPASSSTSVINVTVAGDRTTLTNVSSLAGVVLRLYSGDASGPNSTPLADSWATCTSDAAGDCSFVVPNTQRNGANRDRRFWVKQSAAPSGYFQNASLAVGATAASAPYQFRTGTQLRANTTYLSTDDFMIAAGNTNNQASGGLWQTSRNNPALPNQCGLDVALIVDLSGSVSPYLTELKTAAKGFVDSLTGTASSMALFTFANVAPAPSGANLGVTTLSTPSGATTIKNRIDTYTANGATNWDRGIYQAAASSANFDVAIVLTDGDPTSYAGSEGPGNRTRFREVENGVFSANALKAKGTRIIAFGVGDGVSGAPNNLRAISGPGAGSDYYQTANYAAAGAALRTLALGNCAGSVSIVKQVVSASNSGEGISGAQPQGGWTFSASTGTTGVTPATQSGITETGTGAVNFPLAFASGVTSGTVNIAETQEPGYSIVTQGGNRAVCTNINTGASVPVTNSPSNPNGFSISAPANAAVTCTVYNKPPLPQSDLTVDKKWVVNGVAYDNGDQPIGLNAQLALGGTNQAWGSPRTGLTVGSTVAIAETTSFPGRDLCTLTSSRITSQNGSSVSLALPYNATIGEANTYTVTNTVTCTGQLTLVKQVQGGNAAPTDWTLTAVTPGGALPGPTGVSGSAGATALVTPEVSYPLAESGGSPLYTQTVAEGGSPQPPSTGSWSCVQVDSHGAVIPGFADGLNGAVIVPLGFRVRCTAVNQTASLTLVKQVVNDNGGTRIPSDWTLTATPTGTAIPGVTAQSVTGNTEGATVSVRPGQAYSLTENTLPGYNLTSLTCDVGPDGTFVNATSVTLSPLDQVTCIYVNDDQAATLTLIKKVDNGTTGATTPPSAWTLTASGPRGFTGAGDSAAVTAQSVTAGVYTLSESGGPSGYTASLWSCTGVIVSTGASVTLAPGDSATCTITNTAVAPTLTLVKRVANSHGGTRAASDFPLTATSPSTTISGQSGTPAVTAATATVGTYALSETNPDTVGYSLTGLACANGTTALGTTLAQPNVTLGLGDTVVCTYTNTDKPATLTLIKEVAANGSGTTRVPADWTLTASPRNITGQAAVSGNGSGATATGGVQSVSVSAGSYELSENGPAGFDAGSWVCEGGVVTNGAVTVPNGGNVICRITNTAVSPTLTLVKVVDNGNTSAESTPADWTLSGTGPTPITGITGNAAVTAAPVQVGTYALSEVGTPTGYSAGEWSCEGGGTLAGASISLAEGDNATCTITNTAIAPQWTVSKTSDPPTGSAVLPGSLVTYTITATLVGGVAPRNVVISDDMSGVLNNAQLVGLPRASHGTVVAGSTLAWTVGTFSTTATLTYTVRVNEDAHGVTLRNVVTPPTGATCVGTCETSQVTPAWELAKTSNPASGTVVEPSTEVTYTLHARNTSEATVSGATAIDDLRDVLGNATLTQPLPAGLTYNSTTRKLTWAIPTMAPGDPEASVSYTVTVLPKAFGETIGNVVTPGTPGGSCPTGLPQRLMNSATAIPSPLALIDDSPGCETTHRVSDVNLSLMKSHADIVEGAVDSGEGSTIDYRLVVTNKGQDPATQVVVTDALPDGLSYVDGTLVAPDGWLASVTNGVLTATFEGPFAAGDTAAFTFTTLVGDLTRSSDAVPYSPIANTACVTERETDTDPSDNCAEDETPVKSIAVTANAVCSNDTPLASYSVTPYNVSAEPTISLIWWTQEAYNTRDHSIDAGDVAALLADGASQVDPITLPAGWVNGETITGTKLWPGATVDALGNPTDWPGWTQQANGTWVLDPAAPFYNLRDEAIMEIRINPSTAAVLVYPPATPNCNAAPPTVVPPGTVPGDPAGSGGGLAVTGQDELGIFAAGTALVALGLLLAFLPRQRRRIVRGREV